MTIAPLNPTQPTDPDQSTDWHRPMLHAMATIVMRVAEAAGEQAIREAEATQPTQAPTNAGLLVTRLARALRQLVSLDKRLATTPRPNPLLTASEEARRAKVDRQRKQTLRKKIRRDVQRSIEADTENDHENLLSDLDDRLADDDIDALLLTHTLRYIVGKLCAEFRVTYVPDPEGPSDYDWSQHAADDPEIDKYDAKYPGPVADSRYENLQIPPYKPPDHDPP